MPTTEQQSNAGAWGLGWRPPDPIVARFESPRLLIRPFEIADVEPLQRTISSAREHLYPWVTWARTGHRTPSETARFIADQLIGLEQSDPSRGISLAVCDKATGQIIGGTGIHFVRPETASAETGYWIAHTHTGRGFAAEACRHTISWAFRPQDAGGMGLRRVSIVCSDRNEPSRRLIESLGIRREMELRDGYWLDGIGLTTKLGWGVLTDEWEIETHSIKE